MRSCRNKAISSATGEAVLLGQVYEVFKYDSTWPMQVRTTAYIHSITNHTSKHFGSANLSDLSDTNNIMSVTRIHGTGDTLRFF